MHDLNQKIAALLTTIIILFFLIGIPLNNTAVKEKLFTIPVNWRNNNNHGNWACHNYAHNMMNQTESNAIFMTEGGDNQVFSLLYFSYVERSRPDVDFFDQKCNVFPRLYGDLMNVYPEDLRIIRDLRDFQLYSTGRPVYLCWRRNGMQNLHPDYFPELVKHQNQIAKQYGRPMRKWNLNSIDAIERHLDTMVPRATFDTIMKNGELLKDQHLKYLGPWYLKMYGILFKVLPIRYAIVDALEIYREADRKTILKYVEEVRKRGMQKSFFDNKMKEIIENQFNKYAENVAAEGYIEISGNRYKLIKPLTPPMYETRDAYWQNIKMDFTNVGNAAYFDYLTREIFLGYLMLPTASKTTYANLKIRNLRKKMSAFHNPAYRNEINSLENDILKYHDMALEYGRGNALVPYNYASTLMRQGHMEKALSNFIKAGRIQTDMHSAWMNATRIVYQKATQSQSEEEEKKHLKQALNYLAKGEEALTLALKKNGKGHELEKNKRYREVQQFEEKLKGELSVPRSKIEKLKNHAGNDPQKLKTLASFYEKRRDYHNAAQTYLKAADQEPHNITPLIKAYEIFLSIDKNKSFAVLNQIIYNYEAFKNAKPDGKFQLIHQAAHSYLTEAVNAARQGQLKKAQDLSKNSLSYCRMFNHETQRRGNNIIDKLQRSINDISSKSQSLIDSINQYLEKME